MFNNYFFIKCYQIKINMFVPKVELVSQYF